MSLSQSMEDAQLRGFTGTCSSCGRELQLPSALSWVMASGNIWLHETCCEELGLNLIKRSARAGYIYGKYVEKTVADLTAQVRS